MKTDFCVVLFCATGDLWLHFFAVKLTTSVRRSILNPVTSFLKHFRTLYCHILIKVKHLCLCTSLRFRNFSFCLRLSSLDASVVIKGMHVYWKIDWYFFGQNPRYEKFQDFWDVVAFLTVLARKHRMFFKLKKGVCGSGLAWDHREIIAMFCTE